MESRPLDAIVQKGLLEVVARPGARKTELLAIADGVARIAVAAPPEQGKANRELERFVGRLTGKRARIISGAMGRRKTLRLG